MNLQKLVNVCEGTANNFAKFHAKRLNQSENIPKSFRGGATFFETPCIVFRLCKASSLANFARLIPQNVSLSDEIVVGPNDFSVGGKSFKNRFCLTVMM